MTSSRACVVLDFAQFKASGSTGSNIVSWDRDNEREYGNGWVCTCEDYFYRKHECKHIREAKKILEGCL